MARLHNECGDRVYEDAGKVAVVLYGERFKRSQAELITTAYTSIQFRQLIATLAAMAQMAAALGEKVHACSLSLSVVRMCENSFVEGIWRKSPSRGSSSGGAES